MLSDKWSVLWCLLFVPRCPVFMLLLSAQYPYAAKWRLKSDVFAKNLTWGGNEVIPLCKTRDTATDCGLLINALSQVEHQS